MNGEKNLGILPTDLILQILSRLPSKYATKCRCVSKLWTSLLGSPYFNELFLTQSKTRPRLLFLIRRNINDWCLYSCPQPQISDKNLHDSSLSVTAEFHMSLFDNGISEMPHQIIGLLYSPSSEVLCNPNTRQLFRLPHPRNVLRSYFGYDPIDKQFSLLAINHPLASNRTPSSHQILKLGSGKLSWRSLECPLRHYPFKTNICINGILYYMAYLVSNPIHKIVCFDLNSEEFKIIDQPCGLHHPEILVNFKGKLGGIEKKTLQKVKIRGFEGFKIREVFGYVDYVEEIRALKWS